MKVVVTSVHKSTFLIANDTPIEQIRGMIQGEEPNEHAVVGETVEYFDSKGHSIRTVSSGSMPKEHTR